MNYQVGVSTNPSQKRNSADTDLFFIIESLTIYLEKLFEIMDEPLKNYSKTEWVKFKELLTSTDLSPCKCFSYANALKLVKPQPIVKVATFNLGDLGDSNKKVENTITPPSLMSINNSQASLIKGQYSVQQQGNKYMNDPKESDQLKNKSQQLNVSQQQQQHQYNIQVSPQIQSVNQSTHSNQSSPNKVSNSKNSQATTANTTYNNSIKLSPNYNTIGGNYQPASTLQYLNQNNITPNAFDKKSSLQTLTNFGSESYSVPQTLTNLNQVNGYPSDKLQNNSINSSTHFNKIEERVRSPNGKNNNYKNIYQSKTSTLLSSVSRLKNISQASNNNSINTSTNLNTSTSQSKRVSSQFDKFMNNKTPVNNAHMKAQKSLQIDIKENAFSSRNNGQAQGTNNSLSRTDLSKTNNNTSVGNYMTNQKAYSNSPQLNSHQGANNSPQLTGNQYYSPQQYGGASHLLSSIGSLNGTQNNTINISVNQQSGSMNSSNKFNYKPENNSKTDRQKSKFPEMNSIRTESVLIESTPPPNTQQNSINNNDNQNSYNFSGFAVNQNIKQRHKESIESETSPQNQNGATSPVNDVGQRKRVRRETRKLSLEKFQNCIDAAQNNNKQDSTNDVPLSHNKGFQQVLLNRFDMLQNKDDKKREPSPVNRRITSDKIQEIGNFDKWRSKEEKKENPYMHLIQKVQQRISVFKMDSVTIELVAGKFTNVETKKNKDANKQLDGFQQRQEGKRENLRKYSVFSKQQQGQQNLAKVDDQITKVEQSKLNNPLIKPKKRDDKKKLIF